MQSEITILFMRWLLRWIWFWFLLRVTNWWFCFTFFFIIEYTINILSTSGRFIGLLSLRIPLVAFWRIAPFCIGLGLMCSTIFAWLLLRGRAKGSCPRFPRISSSLFDLICPFASPASFSFNFFLLLRWLLRPYSRLSSLFSFNRKRKFVKTFAAYAVQNKQTIKIFPLVFQKSINLSIVSIFISILK